MSEKLLPCPFCGEAAVYEPDFSSANGRIGLVAITCEGNDCNNYQAGKTKEEAERRWNRRSNTRPTPPDLREADIGRWKAEELEWQKWEVRYRAALIGLLSNPHGCSLCDSGKPRNTAKGHQPDCPYEAARACLPPDVLAAIHPEEQKR